MLAKRTIGFLFIAAFLIAGYFGFNYAFSFEKTNSSFMATRGVWVTCFSEKKVLYSQKATLELIEFCKKADINEIYLQLFRAGQAYYDSKICDRTRYAEIVKVAGIDTVDFLLTEAEKNKIKVFAWVNVLSVGQNRKADILLEFGDTVLTKDQYLRPSIRSEKVNETDKYYLRDEQLFLEPADPNVGEYALSIVDEIITRYPKIKGIHLDYIRYPLVIPFLPDSKFNKYGLVYGYGEQSVARFKEKIGLDPQVVINEKDNYLLWDNWKREQLSALVEKISNYIKDKSAQLLLSCAVIASPERAYTVAFQDWSSWLEKGVVDYVVLMNYTRDNRLAKETALSALAHRGQGKVFLGLGAFLMKDKPQLFFEQYKILTDLHPDGIVFFSYDDIVSLWPQKL